MAFDYKFKEAGGFDKSFRDITLSINAPKIVSVVESYKQNMERVVSHWELPLHLFGLGQIARGTVLHGLTIIKGPDNLPECKPGYVSVCELFNPMVTTDDSLELYNIYDNIDASCDVLNEMRSRMFSSGKWNRLFDGFDSIFSSMIVGAWTAFETLATDLWVTAVNLRPMSLGVNALRAPRGDTADNNGTEMEVSENDKYHPMNLDILQEYNFNLSSSLGTMIHSKQKFNFNKLRGIRNAYLQAFCYYAKSSRKAALPEVKAWFAGEDYKELGTLEAIRHVLVHRAGKVDRAFLDRVKAIREEGRDSPLSTLQLNDKIPLDGHLVNQYISVAVRRGAILVQGVDKWLKKTE